MLIAIKNIDAVVKIIKTSKNTTEAKIRLIEKFKLSDVQAQAILDMRLARLTSLEVTKLETELARLKDLIKRYTEILKNPKMQLKIVKKECFTPMPKIDSALCLLVPHGRYQISNFEGFKNFIHLSFSMRRKTLVNNLKSKYDKEKVVEILKCFNYVETVRPEEISVENFIEIFEELRKFEG